MRAFVTGGSGFVGGHLIRELHRRGAAVRGLARSEGAARAVAGAGAEVVEGDLLRPEGWRAALAGCDVVFHAAAHVGDWGSERTFHLVNVEGTRAVLDAAGAAGVPRLVHVSTEAVLVGGGPLVRVDERRPLPRRPVGLYPRTKGMAETLVRTANQERLATSVVRPRLVWGPGDATVLPALAEAVRSGRFAWIEGGRYPTSTCHVDNAVEGLIRAADRARPGGVYFVTDGPPVEIRAFLTALLATQGLEPGDRSLPRWLARAVAAGAEAAWRGLRLRGAPPLTRTAVRLIGEEVTVDDSRARQELGYREVISREEGLAALRAATG